MDTGDYYEEVDNDYAEKSTNDEVAHEYRKSLHHHHTQFDEEVAQHDSEILVKEFGLSESQEALERMFYFSGEYGHELNLLCNFVLATFGFTALGFGYRFFSRCDELNEQRAVTGVPDVSSPCSTSLLRRPYTFLMYSATVHAGMFLYMSLNRWLLLQKSSKAQGGGRSFLVSSLVDALLLAHIVMEVFWSSYVLQTRCTPEEAMAAGASVSECMLVRAYTWSAFMVALLKIVVAVFNFRVYVYSPTITRDSMVSAKAGPAEFGLYAKYPTVGKVAERVQMSTVAASKCSD